MFSLKSLFLLIIKSLWFSAVKQQHMNTAMGVNTCYIHWNMSFYVEVKPGADISRCLHLAWLYLHSCIQSFTAAFIVTRTDLLDLPSPLSCVSVTFSLVLTKSYNLSFVACGNIFQSLELNMWKWCKETSQTCCVLLLLFGIALCLSEFHSQWKKPLTFMCVSGH